MSSLPPSEGRSFRVTGLNTPARIKRGDAEKPYALRINKADPD